MKHRSQRQPSFNLLLYGWIIYKRWKLQILQQQREECKWVWWMCEVQAEKKNPIELTRWTFVLEYKMRKGHCHANREYTYLDRLSDSNQLWRPGWGWNRRMKMNDCHLSNGVTCQQHNVLFTFKWHVCYRLVGRWDGEVNSDSYI